MKYFIPISFSILLLCACNRIVPIPEIVKNPTHIKLPSTIDTVKMCKYSEVYDSVKLIKLQTTKESRIGRIDKILFYDNNYFILDQVEGKTVLEFNSDGKFLRRFGLNGHGVGKYNEPNDMSIKDGKLAIWVNDTKKFILYNLSGKFLKEVKTKSYAKSAVQLNNDRFAIYIDIGFDVPEPGEEYNLKILDYKGKQSGVAFKKMDKEFSKGSFFFNQNDDITLISPGYSDDIYSVNKDSVVKKYAIDFGLHKIPSNFYLKSPNELKFDKALRRSDYAFLERYSETPNYLFFSFVYHSVTYNCFYSKRTGTLKYGNMWFNNLHGILQGTNVTTAGDNVIAYYDPSAVDPYKEAFKNDHFSKDDIQNFVKKGNESIPHAKSATASDYFVPNDFRYTKEEIDDIRSINTSDNPILLIQKLKKF